MLTNLEVRALESLCSMSRAVCEIRDMLRDSSDAPAEDSPAKVDRLRAFVRELCDCLEEEDAEAYKLLIEKARRAAQ
jgi:hypothetical protein